LYIWKTDAGADDGIPVRAYALYAALKSSITANNNREQLTDFLSQVQYQTDLRSRKGKRGREEEDRGEIVEGGG
jgi:hypothetical protein